MINRLMGVMALLVLSLSVSAASVSITDFSGSGYSHTETDGGYSNGSIFSGYTAARETSQGVYSVSGSLYIGTTSASGTFNETTDSRSTFSGTATNDGLVGRTVQTSDVRSRTTGEAFDSTSAFEAGLYTEFSAVGDGYNGIIGGETGGYVESSYENSYTDYGSQSYASTYSVDSYSL